MVSQPPAPDSGPLSVMNEAYAGFRAEFLGKRTYAVTYALTAPAFKIRTARRQTKGGHFPARMGSSNRWCCRRAARI